MKRRAFIQNTMAATALSMVPAWAKKLGISNLGIQLFSVPKYLSENFEGTIEMLAGMGYKELEFYGPYSFSEQAAKDSWAQAANMLGFSGSGLFGKSPQEIIQILTKYNLKATATHTDLDTLEKNMDALAETANMLGMKYVGLPAIPDQLRVNLDDYKKMADRFNKIGMSAKKHGLKFSYHNHGYGFAEMEGKIPVIELFDHTDPENVILEMDLFWTAAAGADPVNLLKKYKNRYQLLHIKDMTEHARFSGDGGDMTQWFALFSKMTSCGEGVLDLPLILETAKANGTKHFYVEQDMVSNPEKALKISADYLQEL